MAKWLVKHDELQAKGEFLKKNHYGQYLLRLIKSHE